MGLDKRFCKCFGRPTTCNTCAEVALAALAAVCRAGERDLERAHLSHLGGCGEDCDCSHRVPGSSVTYRAETLCPYPLEAPRPGGRTRRADLEDPEFLCGEVDGEPIKMRSEDYFALRRRRFGR